jgi:two-component system NtrC family sensor kinase
MTDSNPFSFIPPGSLLYLNYGLAFIVLGVVIVSKNLKGSRLEIATPLKYLAMFGFTHGTLEWFELFLLFQGRIMLQPQILMVKTLGFIFGVSSFFFLMQFAISLLRRISNQKQLHLLYFLQLAIFLIWISSVAFQWLKSHGEYLIFLQHADIMSRYCLALSSSLLASFAFMIYSFEVQKKSKTQAQNFFRVSVGFFIYGFLAGLIPSKMIIPVINVPIEFFRMVAAISITLFIVKALNIFNLETRRMVVDQTKQLVQSEKLASLGRLAAGVAHEINNPLTNASLNVQMVKKIINSRNEDDESLTTKIDAIGRNIERASIIARELLRFSRNDTEVFSKVNLNVIIQHALDTVDYKLPSVHMSKNLDILPEIKGNFGKLQQVFINILHNSLEAMGEVGEIEITTKIIDDNIEVSVSDSGVGIPEEKLEKLFDPFFTTKEIGKGTGLGLFICYGIIHQHNGKISIKSNIDQGTKVIIELPIHSEGYEKNTDRG